MISLRQKCCYPACPAKSMLDLGWSWLRGRAEPSEPQSSPIIDAVRQAVKLLHPVKQRRALLESNPPRDSWIERRRNRTSARSGRPKPPRMQNSRPLFQSLSMPYKTHRYLSTKSPYSKPFSWRLSTLCACSGPQPPLGVNRLFLPLYFSCQGKGIELLMQLLQLGFPNRTDFLGGQHPCVGR